MGIYCFEGFDRNGTRYRERLEADSRQEALAVLHRQELVITRLKRQSCVRRLVHRRRKCSVKFQMNFCRQMSVMLAAGIPIAEAVNVLAADSSAAERGLGKLLAELQKGYALSDAMQRTEGCFSDFVIGAVKAGELSGNLEKTLLSLHDILSKRYEAEKKLHAAMLYPLLLCGLSIVLVIFLLYHVLPVFADVFAGFHAQLPWTTLLLLDIRDNLPVYVFRLLGGAMACLLLWHSAFRSRRLGTGLDRYRLRLPVWGRLYLRSEQALFLAALAMLVQGGIGLNYGIELMRNMSGNLYLRFYYDSLLRQLRQGYGFGSCLSRDGLYPAMAVTMVIGGEKTGELARMLGYAGAVCQEEADSILERIQVLAEPLAIIILGGMIGFIVLSTVLPVLDLMTVM